jgi:hypothetical protein
MKKAALSLKSTAYFEEDILFFDTISELFKFTHTKFHHQSECLHLL